MAIAVYVNGKKEEIGNSLTIQGLLDVKKIKPEVVTVELNEEIIAKDKYKAMVLKSGDKLELVYYMGGGLLRPSTSYRPVGLRRTFDKVQIPTKLKAEKL